MFNEIRLNRLLPGLFVGVFAAAALSMALPRDGALSPVWLATGFSLAALLAAPLSAWPLILITCAAAQFCAEFYSHVNFLKGLCLTFCNLVEALSAAAIIRGYLRRAPDFSVTRDLVVLTCAAAGAALVSAVLSSTALFLLTGSNFESNVRYWTLAHTLGLLTITPCLSIIFRWRQYLDGGPITWRRVGSSILLLAVTIGVFAQSQFPVLFLIPPALLLISLDLGVFGAAAGVLAVQVIALASLFTRTGPMLLIHSDAWARPAIMQVFLFVALISSLPLAVAQVRRRQAMAALALSEARYRRLADNASDIVTEADLRGRFTYVSPAVATVTGFSESEFVGQRAIDLVHPDDRDRVKQEIAVALTSAAPKPIEHRHICKDGRVIWMECRPTLAHDPATGAPVAVTDVLRDITERKHLESQLRHARTEAEMATAVKSEFLANMSHELRTPLTAILGFSKLLGERADLDAEGALYLQRVSDGSKALLTTVNDILDFSKLEAGQVVIAPHPVHLESVIQSAVDLLAPQAQAKGLTVDVRLETLPDRAMADDTRIRQILLNFMSNAMKFTSKGSVTIEASYNLDEGRLWCQVTDTGPGIPADRLDRLFKRFSQVDASTTRAHGGTGLGLAICKGLAEAMGGSVGASSVAGVGSRFWFEIPCAIVTETAAPLTSAPPFEDIGRLQGLRVLVADDNTINRELVKIILTQFGAEVAEAVGGVDAVRSAKDARYDVILMDMRMPDMDGAAAAQSIRGGDGENGRTPIIAFTADVDDSGVMSEPGSPFDGLVAKPLIAADLIATVVKIAAAGAAYPDLPVSASALGQLQV